MRQQRLVYGPNLRELGNKHCNGAPQSLASEQSQQEFKERAGRQSCSALLFLLVVMEKFHMFNFIAHNGGFLSRGNNFSMINIMACKKRITAEEELELSCVPVRQVQEDLVRDIGSRPRWLVAASLILHPSPGRMLKRTSSPNSGEDRDVVDDIPLHSNNDIKAKLPVRLSPVLARPCVQMTEEVDFISFRGREREHVAA